jgi:transcription antitermination factor NusG
MSEFSRNERFWYALYTRPRFEKKVDSILKQKDLHSFLPVRSTIHHWSNGKRRIAEPLFPSYVFLHADLSERCLALQSYGVARFVSFGGQPARIPDEQIEDIYRILQHGYDPEPFCRLNKGDMVEIVSGPLQGLRGIYVEDRGMRRLVLSVDIIRQAIAIAVEKGQIRRIKRL